MVQRVEDILLKLTEIANHLNSPFFFVGGCVRDAFYHKQSFDIDLAMNEDLFYEAIKIFDITQTSEFMTATLNAVPYQIDLAVFRTETYHANKGLPDIMISDLVGDLKRRDFTINTGYVEVTPQSISDLLGHSGPVTVAYSHPLFSQDIKQKCIRTLHEDSFYEDPSRLMRAVKYMVTFDLSLEPLTEDQFNRAVQDNWLTHFSKARYKKILLKYIEDDQYSELLHRLNEHRLLIEVVPEISEEAKPIPIAVPNRIHENTVQVIKLLPELSIKELQQLELLAYYSSNLTFWFNTSKTISRGVSRTLMVLERLDCETILDIDLFDLLSPFSDFELAIAWIASQTPQSNANLERYINTLKPLKIMINRKALIEKNLPITYNKRSTLGALQRYKIEQLQPMTVKEEINWIESKLYEHRY
ncbi:MAG: hypothetical protein BGO41_01865 [Clostridiales bacterium 38-18]|nr:MAG: hypothetical protein BGO41_01865 [Clostridiales bacterium 38-18]